MKGDPVLTTSRPVLLLFAVTFLCSASVVTWLIHLRSGVYEPEGLKIFLSLFIFGDYWPAVLSLILLPFSLLKPVQAAGMRVAETLGERPWPTAAVTLVVLALGARYIYQAHPLSMDEYSPSFQSRAFAAGHLAGQFPVPLLDWLVPLGFQNVFLSVSHQTGQVLSAYWPGFALLLTPFTLLGVPWLCNPVLGAASVLVLHRLAMELFGSSRLAGLAVLLALASTAFSINAISFYSMTAHALANALFVLLLLEPNVRRCILAGFVGSFALVLHNPLPHLLFAIPWLVWLALRQDRLRVIPAIALGYLPLCLVLGLGWSLYLAGVRDAPVAAQLQPGFLESWQATLGSVFHWPSTALLHTRAIGLAKLWIWAVPGLLLLALVGWWTKRADIRIRLLGLSCIATLAGYLFVVFDQGHGWGFRYFHSAWLCLPLLAVAAVATGHASARFTTCSFAAGMAALCLIPATALQAWQVHEFVDRHLAQLPTAKEGTAEVVIVSGAMGYYAADLVQNDPFLRDPVIRMYTHGRDANQAMMRKNFSQLSPLSRGYRGEVWGTADATSRR